MNPDKIHSAVNGRFVRIRDHFSYNRDLYITAVVAAAVAGGVAYYFGVKNAKTGDVMANVAPKITNIASWKPTSNQTIEVFIEALGDPGNIVQDVTTGTIYASQGQAARALGVQTSRISEHLAGKLPNVKGHELVKLGKAVVNEAA